MCTSEYISRRIRKRCKQKSSEPPPANVNLFLNEIAGLNTGAPGTADIATTVALTSDTPPPVSDDSPVGESMNNSDLNIAGVTSGVVDTFSNNTASNNPTGAAAVDGSTGATTITADTPVGAAGPGDAVRASQFTPTAPDADIDGVATAIGIGYEQNIRLLELQMRSNTSAVGRDTVSALWKARTDAMKAAGRNF